MAYDCKSDAEFRHQETTAGKPSHTSPQVRTSSQGGASGLRHGKGRHSTALSVGHLLMSYRLACMQQVGCRESTRTLSCTLHNRACCKHTIRSILPLPIPTSSISTPTKAIVRY